MEWWHWFTTGAALLVLDVALVNVYFLLWLGLGGMVTGIVAWVAGDMPFWLEVVVFVGFSSLFLAVWFYVFKPRKDRQVLAKAREQIPGVPASVIRFSNGKGLLRLQRPVGGRDVWKFTSSDQLHAGEQLTVSNLDDKGVASAARAASARQGEAPEVPSPSTEQTPA